MNRSPISGVKNCSNSSGETTRISVGGIRVRERVRLHNTERGSVLRFQLVLLCGVGSVLHAGTRYHSGAINGEI
jgi:hypothetical protein